MEGPVWKCWRCKRYKPLHEIVQDGLCNTCLGPHLKKLERPFHRIHLRWWKEEEVAVLREASAQGHTVEWAAKKVGRPANAVALKARREDIKLPWARQLIPRQEALPPGPRLKNNGPWTPELVEEVRRLRFDEGYSFTCIGILIGKSRNAVIGIVHRNFPNEKVNGKEIIRIRARSAERRTSQEGRE